MEPDRLHAVARSIVELLDPKGELVRAWPMVGGVSAQVFGIEFNDRSGPSRKVVVRQHGARDRARNPEIARAEFRLLAALRERGIAVPGPILVDDSGQILPAPYLVVEFIEGETTPGDMPIERMSERMARQLAAIHRVDWQKAGLGSLPDQDEAYARRIRDRPHEMVCDMGEDLARATLERRGIVGSRNRPVLLHGDFWPGNLLWHEGAIAAVIDWEDAAIGDPLADLANCRIELLLASGVIAMDAFTHYYAELAPLDLGELPYWDLFAAIGPILRLGEWGLSPETERSMRERHGAFVRQALQRIAASANRS